MSGTNLHVLDVVDLVLMKAARGRRARNQQGSSTEEFYDEFFTDEDERLLGEAKDRRKIVRLAGVRDAVRRHAKKGRLLDVGCGCGDNLAELTGSADLELHGVEFSRATLARAQRRLGAKADLRQGSAMELPYEDASFDTLTCIEVLEHIPDDTLALREMWRVLRPDGVLVMTVPSRHWFPEYRELIGHERHYDRAGLLALLASCGFAEVAFIPNYPRWHRAADYAYVGCRALGMIAGKLGKDSSPYTVQLPLTGKPLLSLVNDALEPLFRLDERLPYADLDTSTSLVARKVTRATK